MTVEQLNKRMLELAEVGKFDNAIVFTANDTKDLISERVFEKSENVAGGVASSASYGTNELWVDPVTLPRAAGSPIGKRGKPIKSRYFSGGWAQVKREVGKPNYELTGDLASDFNSQITIIRDGICQLRLKRPENADKVEGLDVKYGKTFAANQAEREYFRDELSKLVIKEINIVL